MKVSWNETESREDTGSLKAERTGEAEMKDEEEIKHSNYVQILQLSSD